MSVDREFRIRVKTTSETGALKEATGELGKLAGAAKAVNQAQSAGTEVVKEAAKETAKHTEKLGLFGLKIAEQKKLLGELGQEFPLVAQAARAMMNPVVATASAAIAVFGAAKRAIAEWNAEMDEAAKRASSPDFKAGMEAQAEAFKAAAGKATEFAVALQNVAKSGSAIEQMTQRLTGNQSEFTSAREKRTAAEEAGDLSEAEWLHKKGLITDAQFAVMQSRIKETFRVRREREQGEEEQAALGLRADGLGALEGDRPRLAKQESAARRRYDFLKARLAGAMADKDSATKKQEEAKQELNKALEEQAEAENNKGWSDKSLRGRVLGAGLDPSILERARGRSASARAEFDRWGTQIARNQKIIDAIEGDGLPRAAADLSLWTGKSMANEQSITRLRSELPAQMEQLDIRAWGRGDVSALQGQTARTSLFGTLEGLSSGKQKEEAELRRQIQEFASSGRGVTTEMIAALKRLTAENAEIRQQIRSLQGTRDVNRRGL